MSDQFSGYAEDPDPQPHVLEEAEQLESSIDYPDLEHSELDCRLRQLAWPKAPEGVKERILESILGQAADGSGTPGSVKNVKETQDITTGTDVHRHEVSRRRLDLLCERVLEAPRRERRYAAVL
jgi:hypothetical protein